MNAPIVGNVTTLADNAPLAPSLERERVRLYLLMLVVDIVLILSAFAAVGLSYLAHRPVLNALLQAQLLLPLYLTLALYQRAYSIKALQDWRFAAGHALMALGLAAALLIFITFYTKSTASFSRVVFTGGIVCGGALLVASRWLLGRWIARTWGPHVINTLHIVAGGPDLTLAHAIRLDARASGLAPNVEDPHALDRIGRVMRNMDRVIVSCAYEDRAAWADVLRAGGVRGELVTDRLNELQPIGLSVEEGWLALVVSTGPLGLRQRAIKRVFDIVLSIASLIALSPVMLLTALAILIEDGPPVFFSQRRLGRGNRFFKMYKFRSMRRERADADGHRSASPQDDRVTQVGRFIRRTSIDELPQLFNVLKGEMSLVGPRPHALGSQAGDKLFWEVDQAYWRRHSLKPGITGLAQVRGYRGATDEEADLTNQLDADLEYIRSWSTLTDVGILVQTLGVLVHRRAF
ncbi:exopolysaccharide biosynthesis polyprenyl glycosylphosphotransferase [Altererythrobacter aerius]|uniref:Exopolysaccharide biosynthesis polyprenyl glycosylphosphotransferase n=1 Tax=Tsuneonella aeria TaxID=1837929 RepID=A0A6I4TGB8_9SPHN|nr:exopolysaccharide biosynthesis polyprenyl glycosylphosphotransferase [Tsuneonella aeria]MXO75548.1 exopolysaccharide biosynthesis polyprenyl glycosylphosphotransferase [Tsuneonella aeria]